MSQPIVSCGSYRFPVPKGWRPYISGNDVGLAAENFPAWMWIYPHDHTDIQAVRAELERGLATEDINLAPEGSWKRTGKNAVAAHFAGTISGARAKGRMVGALAPKGGGIFIFAATSLDEFFDEVCSTADAVANDVQY